jgi:sulfate adenylyltransferase
MRPRGARRESWWKLTGDLSWYIATPLSCASQEISKGLYAKARAGFKGVYGGLDPYETPTERRSTIDTSKTSPGDAVEQILVILKERKYYRRVSPCRRTFKKV